MEWKPEPMETALGLDSGCKMADEERAEVAGKTTGMGTRIVVKVGDSIPRATCSSPAMELCPFLSGVLAFNQGLYLSSPSQSVDLRPDSIWLCRAESFAARCPTGCRPSVAMRTRKGACRTPSGRLFGPIGRLFRPSGQGLFRGGAERRSSVCGTRPPLGRQTGDG